MKKKQTPEEKAIYLCEQINKERQHWECINQYGCNDPFWADGCNMNLIRNHILSYKKDIRKLCEEYGLNLPDAYYMPVPPEVDNNYMAPKGKYKAAREKRLKQQHNRIVHKKPYKINEQMSFL